MKPQEDKPLLGMVHSAENLLKPPVHPRFRSVPAPMGAAGFPHDGYPELYPLGDHRYPTVPQTIIYRYGKVQDPVPLDETTYRGGGRYQTRRNLFTKPPYAVLTKGPHAENGKDMRFAGVTTQQFSDIALNEIVGYKDQYWKQEKELNPKRERVHNILNNRVDDAIPYRPPRMVPIIPRAKLDQAGTFVNYQSTSFRRDF